MTNSKETIGYIHSIESMATLDGPGLRTVIFTQGCPLKCKYCHNVDSTINIKRNPYTPKQLVDKIIGNKVYWDNYSSNKQISGGVTISGGDPVMQPQFVSEIFEILKKKNVHTAIDTSLYTNPKIIDKLAPNINLWMVSIKEFDSQKHKDLTGVSNEKIIQNLKYLDEKISKENLDTSIRLRYVVVPEYTDKPDMIQKLIDLAKNIHNLSEIELLGYTELGKYKWQEIFGKYEFSRYKEATRADVAKVSKIINTHHIKTIF